MLVGLWCHIRTTRLWSTTTNSSSACIWRIPARNLYGLLDGTIESRSEIGLLNEIPNLFPWQVSNVVRVHKLPFGDSWLVHIFRTTFLSY